MTGEEYRRKTFIHIYKTMLIGEYIIWDAFWGWADDGAELLKRYSING